MVDEENIRRKNANSEHAIILPVNLHVSILVLLSVQIRGDRVVGSEGRGASKSDLAEAGQQWAH